MGESSKGYPLKRLLLSAALLLASAQAWSAAGGTVTFPDGVNGDVQYNAGGRFGADDGQFTYSTSTRKMSVPWVALTTMTANGLTYYFPASQAGGYFLKTDGMGGLSWETPTTFVVSTVTTIAVLDGSVVISSPTSILALNGSQFIATLGGATTAIIRLDPSTVTLLGSQIDLGTEEVAGFLPSTAIAAGSLGSGVIASSVAVGSVTDSAIVSLTGSKVTGNIPGNAVGITGTVNVSQVVGAVTVYPATATILIPYGGAISTISGTAFQATATSVTASGAGGLRTIYEATAGSLAVTSGLTNLRGVMMTWPSSATVGNYLMVASTGVLQWGTPAGSGGGSGGGDSLGTHVATKTVTADYGLHTTTVTATAFDATVTSFSVTGTGGMAVNGTGDGRIGLTIFGSTFTVASSSWITVGSGVVYTSTWGTIGPGIVGSAQAWIEGGVIQTSNTSTVVVDTMTLDIAAVNSATVTLKVNQDLTITTFTATGVPTNIPLYMNAAGQLAARAVRLAEGQDVSGTLPDTYGGTGFEGPFYDGQIFVGNTLTGHLSTGTLTAGSNVTISSSSTGFTINSTASGGGGGSVLAVGTGTASGWPTSVLASSPTTVVLFSPAFKVNLQGGSTAFVQPQFSSITAIGIPTVSGNMSLSVGAFGVPLTSLSTGVVGSLPAASVAAGSLGSTVIASSIAVGAIDVSVHTNLTVSGQANLNGDNIHVGPTSLSTGVVSSLPAASIAAGNLGSTVVASSIAVGAIDISVHTNLTATGNANMNGDALNVGPIKIGSGTLGAFNVTTTSSSSTGAAGSFTSYEDLVGSMSVVSGQTLIRGVQMVWPTSGTVGKYLQYNSTGVLQWMEATATGGGGGDNFGSHSATQAVIANYGIIASSVHANAYAASTSSMTILKPLYAVDSSTFAGGIAMSSGIWIIPTPLIVGNTTLTTSMTLVMVSVPASGAITITLPLAAAYPGFNTMIYKVDSTTNAVNINAAGSDLISGTGTIKLYATTQHASLVSLGGTAWGEGLGGIQITPAYLGDPDGEAANSIATSSNIFICPFQTDVPVFVNGWRWYKTTVGTNVNQVVFGIYDMAGKVVVSTGPIGDGVFGENSTTMTPFLLPPGVYHRAFQSSSATSNYGGYAPNGSNGATGCSFKTSSSMGLSAALGTSSPTRYFTEQILVVGGSPP